MQNLHVFPNGFSLLGKLIASSNVSKKLLVFFVFIEIEVGCIIIITSAEFFEDPSLAHLTDTFYNQGKTSVSTASIAPDR